MCFTRIASIWMCIHTGTHICTFQIFFKLPYRFKHIKYLKQTKIYTRNVYNFQTEPRLLSVTLIFNYILFPSGTTSISIKFILFWFAHFIKSKFGAQLTFHLFNKWRNIYPDSHFIVEIHLHNKICCLWIKKKRDGIYFSYTKTVLLFLHIKDKNLYT